MNFRWKSLRVTWKLVWVFPCLMLSYVFFRWTIPDLTIVRSNAVLPPIRMTGDVAHHHLPIDTLRSRLTYPSMSISRNILDRYQEYLQITQIPNTEILVKAKFSDVKLENESAIFMEGSDITVNIRLYNGYKQSLKHGGDLLHIWLREPDGKSEVAGYVIDNMDGSYTGMVRALWPGKPSVKVSVTSTKESIGLYLNYMKKFGSFKFTEATFSGEKHNETTQCSASPHWINMTYGGVCDLTSENFNISYYCGKPKHAPCSNWKLYAFNSQLRLDKNTTDTLKYRNIILKVIPVTVSPSKSGRNDILNFSAPSKPCHSFPKSATWNSAVPSGFVHKGRYHNLLCNSTVPQGIKQYQTCLKDRPLIFVGDSTTRHWFFRLASFLNLNLTQDYENYRYWQKLTRAENKSLGLKMEWLPHEHPFYGHPGSDRHNVKSAAWRLNRIPANSTAIVVLHWYAHISRCCNHVVFREHVRNAKEAIIQLLQRSPEVKVFIKGPHFVSFQGSWEPFAYVAKFIEQVLFEEFQNLQDKIVYLDQWDISVATENVHVHPNVFLNDISLNNLISFACRPTKL